MMKKRQNPYRIPGDTADIPALPVPSMLPQQRRRYLIALTAVLVLCTVVLCLALAFAPEYLARCLLPDEAAATDTSDTLTPTPTPLGAADVPPAQLPTDGAEAEQDAAAPAPPEAAPDLSAPTAPETEQAPPPVVIEQVVLSGSAGMCYRSLGDGNCVLEGIGTCNDHCLIIPERSPDGDTVVSIAAEAFLDCEQLVAVQIPATVQSIGVGAFGNCRALVLFSVAAENVAFCAPDGALYSRDGSALICYPAGRCETVANLPAGVNYISAMAFCDTGRLQQICYGGSVAAWRAVTIGEGNEILYTLPKQFGAAS